MFLIFLEKQFFKHLFHHHFIQICWNSLRNIGHTVDLLYKDSLLLAKSKMLNFSKKMPSCLYTKCKEDSEPLWGLWAVTEQNGDYDSVQLRGNGTDCFLLERKYKHSTAQIMGFRLGDICLWIFLFTVCF